MKLRKVIATALLATVASGAVAIHATSSTSTAAPASAISAAPREHGASASTGERAKEAARTRTQADPKTMVDRFAALTGSLGTTTSATPTANRGAGAYLVDGSDRAPGSSAGATARAGTGGSTFDLLAASVGADLATNDDFPVAGATGLGRDDGTTKLMYSGEPYYAIGGYGYLDQAKLPAQVGRLYEFDQDAVGKWVQKGSCSGTIVARDLVLTAAHCVKGSGGWVFYPGLYGDNAPYGSWASTSAMYDAGYDGGLGDTRAFDYGFVKLQPSSAGTLPGDVINPFPVLTDSTQVSMDLLSEGYPVDGWWNSNGNCNGDVHCYPWYCQGARAEVQDHGNGFRSMGIGCLTNGGMSGGPMFGVYNGQWYVVSVNSTGGYLFDEAGNTTTARPCWYMYNLWGPEFRQGRYDSVRVAAEG